MRSGNFSIGVNMLVGLVAQVAGTFPADAWDIEVLEAHHRRVQNMHSARSCIEDLPSQGLSEILPENMIYS